MAGGMSQRAVSTEKFRTFSSRAWRSREGDPRDRGLETGAEKNDLLVRGLAGGIERFLGGINDLDERAAGGDGRLE